MRLLVQAGSILGSRDIWGNTALHWAKAFERGDIVEYLESEGADGDLANDKGKQPADVEGARFRIMGSGAESLLEIPAGRLASACLPVDGEGTGSRDFSATMKRVEGASGAVRGQDGTGAGASKDDT